MSGGQRSWVVYGLGKGSWRCCSQGWGNLIFLPQGFIDLWCSGEEGKVWALWGQEVTHFGTCRGLNEESVASTKDLQVSEK